MPHAPYLLLLCLLFIGFPVSADTYNKKSISGPSHVFIAPYLRQNTDNYETNLNKTIKEGIQLPRFNQNTLPSFITASFNERIQSQNISSKEAAVLFTDTVTKEISKILNDPMIQKKRLAEQKRGEERYTFADTKGKAQNILKTELDTLFNSAFIYFPYINTFDSHSEKGYILSTISGGIYWYQIKNDGLGKREILFIKHIQTNSRETEKINFQSDLRLKLGKEKYLTHLKNETKKKVMQRYASQLKFETKKIENFRLTGRIKEAKGSHYHLNIGTWEGLAIDDTFWILDLVEEEGEEIVKQVGFARVTQVANNKKNPEKFSTAQQLLGPLQSRGGWVKEYPLSKTFTEFNLGVKNGLSISNRDIVELENSGTSAILLGLNIAKNIAAITGKSQTFLDLDLQAGFLQSSTNSDSTGTPLIASMYFYYTKKYAYRSQSFFWKIGLGTDYFNLTGTTRRSGKKDSYTYALSGQGISVGLGYEKLFTPRLSVLFSILQTLSLGVSSAKEEHGSTASESTSPFNNTNFSNLSARLGLNYNI